MPISLAPCRLVGLFTSVTSRILFVFNLTVSSVLRGSQCARGDEMVHQYLKLMTEHESIDAKAENDSAET